MFTCQYCNATYVEFQTTCTGCGSLLEPVWSQQPSGKAFVPQLAQIRKICKDYSSRSPHLFVSTISASTIVMAERSFENFPMGEELFLFCDTTPMGSGIWGFLLSESGMYWQNNGDTPSKHTYLSWDDFSGRKLQPRRFVLEFGQGDVIDLSGMRKYADREKVFRLFRELKDSEK